MTDPATIFASNILQGLHYTYFSAMKASSNVLQGVLTEFFDHTFEMAATDGSRLSLYQVEWALSERTEPFKFVLAPESIELLEDTIRPLYRSKDDFEIMVVASGNYVTVTFQDISFPLTVLDADYPDLKSHIPTDTPIKIGLQREAWISAIQDCQRFANQATNILMLTFRDNTATMVPLLPKQQPEVIQTEVNYTGDTFQMAFNMTYLLDYLSRCQSNVLTLTTAGSLQPAVFQGESHTTHLIMPVQAKVPTSI